MTRSDVRPHRQEATAPGDVLGFALRWCDHGGGAAADIEQRFLMTAAQYFTTVLAELEHNAPAPIHPIVIDKMKRVARKRLWLLN